MAAPQPQTLELHGLKAVIASPAMRSLLELTRRAARSAAAVLITGETGTGKEIIARALHQFSPRAAQPWVDVSCGTIPEHLVESELFGYERGAFSGAAAAKPGLFELAHKGTLFLDEIGELDLRMQARLLRVLDGAPYYRLGGTRKVAVDVRIVAATNQDLEKAVAGGRFRADLFHRLSQLVLRVPPLRERVDDIAPLALHFLGSYEADPKLTREALSVLERYWWPGNVRELRNVLTRAALLADGAPIGPEHLGLPVAPRGLAAPVILHRLDSLERDAIFRALRSTGGHRERAAALLGISRRTLSRKLKRYRERDGRGGPDALPVSAAGQPGEDRLDERALSGKTA